MKYFNQESYKDNEAQNRKNLQNWLNANDIEINVEGYSLDQMDNLISDVEKAIKGRTDLKPYFPDLPKTQ